MANLMSIWHKVEEGISTEKIPPPHIGPCESLCYIFLVDYWYVKDQLTVGGGLEYCRKAGWAIMEQAIKQLSSLASVSVPAYRFLP